MLKRPARGFTLIELLVVVAILALLISILLPSLAAARATSRTVVCAANMRSIGQGWTIYADQNRGSIVPARMPKYADAALNVSWVGNGYQYRARWMVRMGAECGFYAFQQPSPNSADDNTKSIDGSRVFQCAEAAERINNRNYAYGYNFQFLGNSRFKGGLESRGFINFPVKLERIQGAGTVLSADALGTAAGKPLKQRSDYRLDGSADAAAVGNHAYNLDPPRLTASGDFCDDANRANEHRSAPELRHQQRANVLFCDGHAKAMGYEPLGYQTNGDGSVAAGGELTTNRLFSGTGRDDDPPVIN